MGPPAGRRVLAVSPFPDLYGAGRMLLRACTGLQAMGCDVQLLAPEPGEMLDEARLAGIDVHVEPFAVLRKAELAHLARRVVPDVRRLRAAIRAARPDVVYVNTVTVPTALVAAKLAGVPAVCHVREAEEGGSGLQQRLLHLPLALASALVCNSEHSLATARPFLRGSVRRRTHVVYNRIARPATAEPTARADEHGPVRLLLLGRLSPRKGQDVFVRALARLREAGCDVEAVLAGSTFRGYEWFEADLRASVERAGLGGVVRFVGFVDAWAAIAAADVVVVPSLVEPFGNVAVEAGLMGRPVVASRVGGLREIVDDEATGLLVAPGDDVALAAGLRRLVEDADLRAGMGAAARTRCEARFGATGDAAHDVAALAAVVLGAAR